jgi:hypothetical protein
VAHRPGLPPEPLRGRAAELGLLACALLLDLANPLLRLAQPALAFLERLRRAGKRVAGYGAVAKGTILLNFFRIGADDLLWIADKNPHKHGLHVPGMKVPIVGTDRIEADRPDYLLILPWNHREEIMRQQADFARRGGRFIIPIPQPRIVGAVREEA